MPLKLLLSCAVLLFGCNEHGFTRIPEPDIVVTPTEVDFGELLFENTFAQFIDITNVGDATLELGTLSFENDLQPYTMSELMTDELGPNETATIEISYHPLTVSYDENNLLIPSNDRDETLVIVPLKGIGLAPAIEVTPEVYDFGGLYIGCGEGIPVTISNVGNLDLNVTSLDFFVSYPSNFDFELDPGTNGNLPWTLIPGESREVYVDYVPDDLVSDTSFLQVSSNDPTQPLVTVDQTGDATYYNMVTDSYIQSEKLDSDILFVVDNSGSMGEEQTSLGNNFEDFINVFITSGVDFHLGVITTDSSELVGPVLTPSTPNLINTFKNQALVGIQGFPTERGLEQAYQALGPSGDVGPGTAFFRDEALLVLVFVSDEKDYSYQTPAAYTAFYQSLKPFANLVIAHAVAGDYPMGCATAVFGAGYYEVVSALGGSFVSICAPDWGIQMEQLAHQSLATSSYLLSDANPVEDTVKVFVNGIEVYDWTYDASTNAVTFGSGAIPDTGDTIDVEYAVYGGC